MNKMTKKRWLAAVVVLLIGAGTVWALWPDGRVAKAKALQKELFSPEARNLSPEQRKQKWQELREVQNRCRYFSDAPFRLKAISWPWLIG